MLGGFGDHLADRGLGVLAQDEAQLQRLEASHAGAVRVRLEGSGDHGGEEAVLF